MNVKLLKQVRDHIGAHPEKFDQGRWCGSACCVAGNTVLVAGLVKAPSMNAMSSEFSCVRTVDGVDVRAKAKELLDLDLDQAERLFSASWFTVANGRFDIDYLAHTDKKRSRIAVKRINHFIKTKGAE